MPILSSSLADGQLPATKATLYTSPAMTATHVSHIILVNTDSGSRTVNLYIKRSGSSSRRIIAKDQSIAAGARYAVPMDGSASSTGFKLSPADQIEGDADSASKVDYFIDGGLEAQS